MSGTNVLNQGAALTANPEPDREDVIRAASYVWRRAADPALVCEILGIGQVPPEPGAEPGPRMADKPRRARKASGRHG